MGVSAKRWQLWLVTMFILTGIIGAFQLLDGPASVGAVTVAGGVASPSVSLPSRSGQATELPAWQAAASVSQTTGTPTTTQKTVVVGNAADITQATTQSVRFTAPAATQAPTSAVVGAKTVAGSPTQPKVTTTAPKATTPAPKAPTTTAKPTTTEPRPSESVLKPTASATPTTTGEPHCYRFFVFCGCR